MSDFELSRFLLSVMLLLALAMSVGQLFECMKMPRAIGEITAGVFLGPSVLGLVDPELHKSVFHAFPDQEKLLSVFYWLGLILLMFSAGFKVSSTFEHKDGRIIFALIAGGLILPFIFGFSVAGIFPNTNFPNPTAFALVMASACAVTSIPVITRIYLELGLESGRFARLTLTAASLQDLVLWTILSIAIALQQGKALHISGFLVGFAGIAIFSLIVVTALSWLIGLCGRQVLGKTPDEALIGYALLVCLFIVTLASFLHVHIVFGALLAGIVIGRFSVPQLERVKQSILNFSTWFFVPIYFALVGLKIDLPSYFNPQSLLFFLVMSSIVKVISVVLVARTVEKAWMKTIDYGFVMNARGGPGIVLASLAYAVEIIDQSLFVTLVMTSILTSLFAGIWLRWRSRVAPDVFL